MSQMPKPVVNAVTGATKASEEKRRRGAEASARYRKTEKGRIANRVKCRNFYRSHKEYGCRRASAYQARFKEAYGINMRSWNYWQNKLKRGECVEDDVPERYRAVLMDLKLYGHYRMVQEGRKLVPPEQREFMSSDWQTSILSYLGQGKSAGLKPEAHRL